MRPSYSRTAFCGARAEAWLSGWRVARAAIEVHLDERQECRSIGTLRSLATFASDVDGRGPGFGGGVNIAGICEAEVLGA